MAEKETIAIAGATSKAGIEIAYKLAAINYRLLLISADFTVTTELAEDIKAATLNVEIEAIDCLKDGCWEADIIVLAVAAGEEKEIAEKIKEVATQKIVVHILTEKSHSFSTTYLDELQQLLPFSQIVTALIHTETVITGNDPKAVAMINEIASKAGFNIVPAEIKK